LLFQIKVGELNPAITGKLLGRFPASMQAGFAHTARAQPRVLHSRRKFLQLGQVRSGYADHAFMMRMMARFTFNFLLILALNSLRVSLSLHFDYVIVEFGDNIGFHVKSKILLHLQSVKVVRLYEIAQLSKAINETCHGNFEGNQCIQKLLFSRGCTETLKDRNLLIISFGNASLSSVIVSQEEIRSLPPEGFRIRSFCLDKASFHEHVKFTPSEKNPHCRTTLVASNGLPLDIHSKNLTFKVADVHYGAVVIYTNCVEFVNR
jgi:hypothetical protein